MPEPTICPPASSTFFYRPAPSAHRRAVAGPEKERSMLHFIWSALAGLSGLLGTAPHPEDLPSSEPDRGHGMDPNG